MHGLENRHPRAVELLVHGLHQLVGAQGLLVEDRVVLAEELLKSRHHLLGMPLDVGEVRAKSVFTEVIRARKLESLRKRPDTRGRRIVLRWKRTEAVDHHLFLLVASCKDARGFVHVAENHIDTREGERENLAEDKARRE